NLDNYDPRAVQELAAATVAYGNALDTKRAGELNEEMHQFRAEIADLEKQLKAGGLPNSKKQTLLMEWNVKRSQLDTAQARLRRLNDAPEVKLLAERVKDLSRRLQRPPDVATPE